MQNYDCFVVGENISQKFIFRAKKILKFKCVKCLSTGKIPDNNKSIIVLYEKNNMVDLSKINAGSVIVANTEQLPEVYDNRAQIISCGFSNKDTVTFSSLSSDSCIASLQRSINFLNNCIEPHELIIKRKGICDKELLLLAAVSFLNGD